MITMQTEALLALLLGFNSWGAVDAPAKPRSKMQLQLDRIERSLDLLGSRVDGVWMGIHIQLKDRKQLDAYDRCIDQAPKYHEDETKEAQKLRADIFQQCDKLPRPPGSSDRC
jgi:hypothetical protein